MRDTKVIENNRTYLWCRFSGSPPPSINWLKEGRSLHRVNRLQVITVAGTSSLVIQKAAQIDTGNYTCWAQQQDGFGSPSTVSSTAHLRVLPFNRQVSNDYPRIIRKPERKTYELMSTAQLECSVRSGRSQPQVTWFRNQTPIAINSDPRLSIGGSTPENFALHIRDAVEADSAEYECVAWTSLDGYQAVSQAARIYVKGMSRQSPTPCQLPPLQPLSLVPLLPPLRGRHLALWRAR